MLKTIVYAVSILTMFHLLTACSSKNTDLNIYHQSRFKSPYYEGHYKHSLQPQNLQSKLTASEYFQQQYADEWELMPHPIIADGISQLL